MHMVLLVKQILKQMTSKRKLSLDQQNKFISRLNRLLENGYSLIDALEVLEWDNHWKEPCQLISSTLKQGKPIYLALSDAGFNQKIVSFLYFAMAHGDLQGSLSHCNLMLQQQLTLSRKFKQVSRYPLVLFLFFIILLYFLKTSVYPSFIQLFSSTSQSSAFHSIAIYFINYLLTSLLMLGVVSIIIFLCFPMIKRKVSTEQLVKLYEKVYWIRIYQRINHTFLLSIHLSSLLRAGIPLKDCLKILKKQNQLPILSYYAELIIDQLQHGRTFPQALPLCTLLDKELQSIFQKDTNTQHLVKDLVMYAEFLRDYIEEKMKKVIAAIQPIFFCILAGMIIFVYLSLMLPMFQLIKNI